MNGPDTLSEAHFIGLHHCSYRRRLRPIWPQASLGTLAN